MKKKKQDVIEGDLLSPALLNLALGRAAEPKMATVSSLSDRVLALYLDGVLGEGDMARVEAALENDPGLKARLRDLKRVLTEVEEEVPVPPKPSSEGLPESVRIHIGDIPLGKRPGLEGPRLHRARKLANQLSGLLGGSESAGSDTIDKRGVVEASRVLEDIRGMMQGSEADNTTDSYRFERGGLRVEASVSARAIDVSIYAGTGKRPLQGIEVCLASDAGQLVTIHTDDLGHAAVPFPSSNGCLIVMADRPLEIGLTMED